MIILIMMEWEIKEESKFEWLQTFIYKETIICLAYFSTFLWAESIFSKLS